MDASVVILDGIDQKAEGLEGGTMVGQVDASNTADVQAAIDAYKANPTFDNYQAINQAIANIKRIEVVPFGYYRLRNTNRQTAQLYLQPEATRVTAARSDLRNADQFFSFVPTGTEGQYYLYNGNYQYYLGPLTATETQPVVTTNPTEAGVWVVNGSLDGKSQVVCQNNTGQYKGLHLAGDNARLVPWTANAEASLWYIEPATTYEVTIPASMATTVCLPFPFAAPEGVTVYTPTGLVMVNDQMCVKIEEVEKVFGVASNQPVILQSTVPGNYQLEVLIEQPTAELSETGTFVGNLKASPKPAGNYYDLQNSSFVPFTETTLHANKAYYTTETAYESLPLTLQEGTNTGIATIETAGKNVRLYDLNGRRVKHPRHGIYVTSEGQKVFVP